MEDINLLPKVAFENLSTKKKFFYWSLKYGRTIVVVFQAVIIALLFYKLYLYTNFTDVSEKIENKISILEYQSQVEKNLENTQQKISSLKTIKKDAFLPRDYISLVKKIVPKDIEVTTLIFKNNSIRLTARSDSLYLFGQLIENISQEERTENITLFGAQFSEERKEFTFDMEISIKET